jgi:DUF1680 family protein
MRAQLVESHPLVEETRNQVAIKRGPIVYCLESPDLPDGVRVQDVVVPADTKLSAKYDPEFLQGVSVVEAAVIARRGAEWDNTLYRTVVRDAEDELRVRLIPYYAWSNRGPSEMSVWLPVK